MVGWALGVWVLVLSLLLGPSFARADEARAWAAASSKTARDVKESGRLVVHVFVPLCSNDQVVCGSDKAGQPANLGHNLYWGAIFGQKRFFSRKASSFTQVVVEPGSGALLERAVFEKMVPGKAWGREGEVRLVVVFDAFHGDKIDAALDLFYREAERGGSVSFGKEGALRVDVVGYAGHNRMMDGKKPPSKADKAADRAPLPSFVMACYSQSYFEKELEARGSKPLLLTRALMAPEGYVLEALTSAIAENRGLGELRQRTVAAYAKFQRISEAVAGRIF